jgi:hypothetical protein
MTAELETLARRAVACRHWRWMPGMQLIHPAETDGMTGYALRLAVDGYRARLGEYPDLSDPATLGCLLYLVREVGKTADVSAIRSAFKDGSVVWSIPVETSLALKMGLEDGFVKGATEAEALVAALEALP